MTLSSRRLRCEAAPGFLRSNKEAGRILDEVARLEDGWNQDLLLELSAFFEERGWGRAIMNARTPDALFHIDLLLRDARFRGRAVAVEVIDTRHVSSNTRQALGRHLLRRRVLQGYGYHVITFPAAAWNTRDRTELLAELLIDCERAA